MSVASPIAARRLPTTPLRALASPADPGCEGARSPPMKRRWPASARSRVFLACSDVVAILVLPRPRAPRLAVKLGLRFPLRAPKYTSRDTGSSRGFLRLERRRVALASPTREALSGRHDSVTLSASSRSALLAKIDDCLSAQSAARA